MLDYNIHFQVEASTRLEAIAAAVAKLRTGVKLRGVLSARPIVVTAGPFGPFWDVTLSVSEDA